MATTKKENLEKLKKALLKEKQEIFAMLEKNREDSQKRISETGDDIDIATDSFQRELLFELTDGERNRLRQINEALEKIEKGTYGICERCGGKISKSRLKAIPYTKYCIKCSKEAQNL